MSATIELWSDDQEFLNCKQAAAYLGISETSFYRIRLAKGIPSYPILKRPKFRIVDLENFRESQRVHPGEAKSSNQGGSPENPKVRLRGR